MKAVCVILALLAVAQAATIVELASSDPQLSTLGTRTHAFLFSILDSLFLMAGFPISRDLCFAELAVLCACLELTPRFLLCLLTPQ
jgi:hypothetical protein